MKVEVSNGELMDKLSILELKLKNITDSKKLINIKVEFNELTRWSKSYLKNIALMLTSCILSLPKSMENFGLLKTKLDSAKKTRISVPSS